jgi:hypothetical protein
MLKHYEQCCKEFRLSSTTNLTVQQNYFQIKPFFPCTDIEFFLFTSISLLFALLFFVSNDYHLFSFMFITPKIMCAFTRSSVMCGYLYYHFQLLLRNSIILSIESSGILTSPTDFDNKITQIPD